MIKKHQIGLFVDTSDTSTPAYKRLKKSTELTISMEAETEDYDYIADESPTTELTEYKPEIEQPLRLSFDSRNLTDDRLGESFRYILLLDIRHKTLLVLFGGDFFKCLVHCCGLQR